MHEPRGALFAGPDGLDALRIIASGAPDWLAPGGMLAVEIGHRQGDATAELFAGSGLREVAVRADLAGKPRMVTGIR